MKRIIFLLLLSIPFAGISQCLNGIYTIGGTLPDYSTIGAAVNALEINGVCGPVVFDIRDGVYNEQISIDSIAGTSQQNTVTFRSESGDSSLVTLQYTPTSTASAFVIRMRYVHHIFFQGIGIKSNSATYTTNLLIRDSTYEVGLSHCKLFAATTLSNTIANALVYVSDYRCNQINIDHSYIQGSNIGVGTENTSNGYGRISISNNRFINQGIRGCMFYHAKATNISANTFSTNSSSTNYLSIYICSGADTIRIKKNSIEGCASGICLWDTWALNTGDIKIVNNFLNCTTGNALAIGNSRGVDAYFNTAVVSSTTAKALAVNVNYSAPSDRIYNNIFINAGGGKIYDFSLDTNVFCDYNIVHTTGNSFGYYQLITPVSTLGQWRTVSGKDLHSVFNPPFFVSAIDLHILSDFSQNMATFPGTGEVSDYDGDLRATNAYPGADEFIRTPVNIDASAISFATPAQYSCPGVNPVQAIILNNGLQPLNSVDISWQINSIPQGSVSWVGNLSYGDTAIVYLGSYFASLSSDTLTAITSNPNGSADDIPYNDGEAVSIPINRLNGNYTIGGTLPDFATFSAAITALQNKGVCGPVTFKVRNGNYSERIIFENIPGLSASNPVLFSSESGDSSQVILTSTSSSLINNYTVAFGSTSDIHFDHITIDQTSTLHTTSISAGNAPRCGFTNCRIRVNSNVDPAIVCSSDSLILIDSCLIIHGAYGVSINGLSSLTTCWKPTISHCIFQSQSEGAIHINRANSPLIHQNSIQDTTGQLITPILIENTNGVATISYNIICGDYINGVSLNNCPGTVTVSNNMLSLGQPLTNNPFNRNAIHANQVNRLNVFFNSIYLFSPFNNNQDVGVIADADSTYLYNNSIHAKGLAKVLTNTMSSGNVFSDYNNFYAEGSNLIIFNHRYYSNLNDWNLNSGQDGHSISKDPQFYSNRDLHSNEASLRNAGISLSGWADDFDHEIRSNPPDIGSDEFNGTPNDIGVISVGWNGPLCAGSQPIPFIIRNFGTNTISTFIVNYEINSVLQTPIPWTGTLAPGSSVTVFSPTINFPSSQQCSISSWTSQVNNSTDNFTHNDSSLVSYLGTGLSGTYTIGGNAPDFLTLNNAISALSDYGTCGSVEFLVRSGTYLQQSAIRPIKMSNPADSITFRSELNDSSLVRWNFIDPLQLENISRIRFKSLSFYSTSVNSDIVSISNNTTDLQFSHCAFIAPTNTSMHCIYIDAIAYGKISGVLVDHSYFYGAGTGCGVYSLMQQSDITFWGNIFEAQSDNCIQITNGDSVQIQSNSFINQINNSSWHGIDLNNCTEKTSIEQNRMIEVPGIGIYIYGYSGSINTPIRIENNFVHSKNSCIWINNVSFTNINGNTLRCFGSSSTVTISNPNYWLSGNILYNSSGDYCLSASPTAGTFSDYNVFYSTDTLLFLSSYPRTFQEWQDTIGYDLHSINYMPVFSDSLDLHLDYSGPIENFVPQTNLLFDYDGEVRLSMTDPGADENIYSPQGSFVFPGNANNDTIVNAQDLLVIGLYYGNAGFSRTIQGNAWIPMISADWGFTQTNGQDLKHGDCNGDGYIDSGDTNAISLNFGLTENYPIAPHNNHYERTGVPLKLRFHSNSYAPGSWAIADIIISDSTYGSVNLYGLALQINIPTNCITPGSLTISALPSWLIPSSSDGFGLGHQNPSGTSGQIGITRITHTDTTGLGIVGQLIFHIPPTITQTTIANVTINQDTAILSNGIGIPLSLQNDSFIIDPFLIGTNEFNYTENNVKLYPNPTTGNFNITFSLKQPSPVHIELVDQLGRVCYLSPTMRLDEGNQNLTVNLSNIDDGIYWIKIYSNETFQITKLFIKR